MIASTLTLFRLIYRGDLLQRCFNTVFYRTLTGHYPDMLTSVSPIFIGQNPDIYRTFLTPRPSNDPQLATILRQLNSAMHQGAHIFLVFAHKIRVLQRLRGELYHDTVSVGEERVFIVVVVEFFVF